ncbi:MAG: cupin domain-containing protein [Bacteroidota bacterium]
MKTTLFKKKTSVKTEKLANCHNGVGVLDFRCLVEKGELPNGCLLKYIHDDILPPKTSIGNHPHYNCEEYYYILSGEGTMILDDQEYKVASGDFTGVFPGGSHGLMNSGTADLRIIVIGIDRSIP